jgi:hypothetical protein
MAEKCSPSMTAASRQRVISVSMMRVRTTTQAGTDLASAFCEISSSVRCENARERWSSQLGKDLAVRPHSSASRNTLDPRDTTSGGMVQTES